MEMAKHMMLQNTLQQADIMYDEIDLCMAVLTDIQTNCRATHIKQNYTPSYISQPIKSMNTTKRNWAKSIKA